jgi:hypothetical protein
MKFRPDCLAELSGLPAYNFGLSNASVEDLVAIVGFVEANAKAPLRELVIGLDVEAFDDRTPVDPRTLSSEKLRPYVPGSVGRSWSTITQALFGWQALRYALVSLRFHVFPNQKPHELNHDAPDGLVVYDEWDPQLAQGKLDLVRGREAAKGRFAPQAYAGFTSLPPERVRMIRELVEREHARGVAIHVVVPPLHPSLEALRRQSALSNRMRELEAFLYDLKGAGLIQYISVGSPRDFGGDNDGYYDGVHLTEANTNRLLLAMFGRAHGCGI